MCEDTLNVDIIINICEICLEISNQEEEEEEGRKSYHELWHRNRELNDHWGFQV